MIVSSFHTEIFTCQRLHQALGGALTAPFNLLTYTFWEELQQASARRLQVGIYFLGP